MKPKGSKQHRTHATHATALPRLKRAQGQIGAVSRMIEAHEYCPNIIQQLRAAISALRSLEAHILQNHLEHCVHDAMESKNRKEVEAKIKELIRLFKNK